MSNNQRTLDQDIDERMKELSSDRDALKRQISTLQINLENTEARIIRLEKAQKWLKDHPDDREHVASICGYL